MQVDVVAAARSAGAAAAMASLYRPNAPRSFTWQEREEFESSTSRSPPKPGLATRPRAQSLPDEAFASGLHSDILLAPWPAAAAAIDSEPPEESVHVVQMLDTAAMPSASRDGPRESPAAAAGTGAAGAAGAGVRHERQLQSRRGSWVSCLGSVSSGDEHACACDREPQDLRIRVVDFDNICSCRQQSQGATLERSMTRGQSTSSATLAGSSGSLRPRRIRACAMFVALPLFIMAALGATAYITVLAAGRSGGSDVPIGVSVGLALPAFVGALVSVSIVAARSGKLAPSETSAHESPASQWFRALTDATSDAILVLDETYCVLYANSRAETLLEYTQAELCGRSLKSLFPRNYVWVTGECAALAIARRATSRRPSTTTSLAYATNTSLREFEVAAVTSSGSEIPCELRVSVARLRPEAGGHGQQQASHGRRTHFVGVLRDMRARREAERQIRSQRDKAELALERAHIEEYRSKQIMDIANDAVILIDSRCTMISVNKMALKMFQVASESELVGRNVNMLMPPEIAAIHDEVIQSYLKSGRPTVAGTIREVVAMRPRDRSQFPVELSMNDVVVGPNHYFVGMIRDISARRAMQTALDLQMRRTEELRNTVLGTIGDAVLVIDISSGMVVQMNPAARRIFDTSDGSAPPEQEAANSSRGVYAHVSAFLPAAPLERLREAATAFATFECVAVAQGPPRREFPVEVSAGRATLSIEGGVGGDSALEVLVVRDMSNRKRMEEALQTSEAAARGIAEDLKRLVASANAPILTLDHGLRIVEVNAAAARVGGAGAWVAGAPFLSALRAEDIERVRRALEDALAGGGCSGMECTLHGGARLLLSATALRRRDGSGSVVVVGQDITEKRRAIELEAVNETKTRFLAYTIHELRTPLNGIIGMSDLLRETGQNDEQRELTLAIHQSGEQMLTIVNDLLDLQKIEAGKLVLESIPFDPAAVIEDVLQMVAPAALAKGVDVALRVAPDFPHDLLVLGDPHRFKQVAANLMSNGVKFTTRGTVVAYLGAEPPVAGRVELRIDFQDPGIGIDKEGLQRLFADYSQADAAVTRLYGGTGMGLVVSKKLTELMGGCIVVTSAVGKGSRFTIEIPLPIATKGRTGSSEHTQLQAASGGFATEGGSGLPAVARTVASRSTNRGTPDLGEPFRCVLEVVRQPPAAGESEHQPRAVASSCYRLDIIIAHPDPTYANIVAEMVHVLLRAHQPDMPRSDTVYVACELSEAARAMQSASSAMSAAAADASTQLRTIVLVDDGFATAVEQGCGLSRLQQSSSCSRPYVLVLSCGKREQRRWSSIWADGIILKPLRRARLEAALAAADEIEAARRQLASPLLSFGRRHSVHHSDIGRLLATASAQASYSPGGVHDRESPGPSPAMSRARRMSTTSDGGDTPHDARPLTPLGMPAPTTKPMSYHQLQQLLDGPTSKQQPRAPAHEAAGIANAVSPAESSAPIDDDADGPVVLVADDVEMNRRVCSAMLSRAGVRRVICAGDGRAALAAIEAAEGERRVDLVLMDVEMPVLDGISATLELRSREAAAGAARRLPVVALTANALDGARERCLAAGMDDCLLKPLRRVELNAVLSRFAPLTTTDC